MPDLAVAPQRDASAEAVRDEWLARLKSHMTDAKGWAEHAGWFCREIHRTLQDPQIGKYTAPALLLQRDLVGVILNPVSRFVTGADGAVDLYRMPAWDDVANISHVAGEWRLYYNPNEGVAPPNAPDAPPLPWSESSFTHVLNDYFAHATYLV